MNHEVLAMAFQQNVIDFSAAEIQELDTFKMSMEDLEELLAVHNQYSEDRFTLRAAQMENLDKLEKALLLKNEQVAAEHERIQTQKGRSFSNVMDSDGADRKKDSGEDSLKAKLDALKGEAARQAQTNL